MKQIQEFPTRNPETVNTMFFRYGNQILMIIEQEHHMPSMCSEFASDENWTEYTFIQIKPDGYYQLELNKDTDVRHLQALYKVASEEMIPAHKKQLWNMIREATPYHMLSALLQKRRDQRLGEYPKRNSKYAEKIKVEELEELLVDMQGELAENMNDWKMYRDPIPERYVNNEQNKMNYIANWIKDLKL